MTKAATHIFNQLDIQVFEIPRIATTILFLTMLITFYSCKQNKNSKPERVIAVVNKPETAKIDTILNSTTGHVDGRRFVMTCISGYYLFLQNEKGDTLYQDSVYSNHQEFVDFNGDGCKDILIDYMTNLPGIADLLLYDKDEKTYKKVIDFQDFPSAQRIGDSNYFYSYHRSGCADMNWDSDLFYIENYKAIRIGNISGRECDDTNVKDGIYISKIVDGKEIQINNMPINTIKRYKEFKWGFIENYWHKNYKKFI